MFFFFKKKRSLGNGVGDGRLRSFCIGLDGSPDLAAAERVAKHIGTRHYSFTFTIQQVDISCGNFSP